MLRFFATSAELLQIEQGGFSAAIANLIVAGKPIIEGIVNDWSTVFGPGIDPQEGWLYNSDDIHTLVELRKREVKQFQALQRRAMGLKK
jgi:hypothetical protein